MESSRGLNPGYLNRVTCPEFGGFFVDPEEDLNYTIRSMIVIALIIIILAYLGGESFLNCRRRNRMKIRVLVNGTRGKSSVTRLISAALRKSGIATMAKVSGTEPRLIYPSGEEEKIIRKAHPNILEQVKFLKEAARRGAEAVVMEVMALIPQYQWITEHRMFSSTIGVITNVRADHLEVMGPTLEDVGVAISGTIPENSVVVSSEVEMRDFLKEKADMVGTKIKFVSGETITDEMMRPFSYLEHRDNVACALEICRELGISDETALEGMHEAIPDPGVLRTFYVHAEGKKFEFINAFSANDPVSTLQIWRRMEKKFVSEQTKVVLLNGRKDRMARSVELAEFVVSYLPLDYLILTGVGTSHLEHKVINSGFNASKIILVPDSDPERIFERVLESIESYGVLFAAGNIGGGGREIVEYFEGKKND